MTQAVTPLDIRDIHLPAPIDWWPLAPGWWILVSIILGLLVIGMIIFYWRRHHALCRSVQQHLKTIESKYQESQDAIQLVKSISVLLRRTSITSFPGAEIASLTGQDWLSFLDEFLSKSPHENGFSSGVGKVLIEAPYNPNCEVNTEELLVLSRFWLKKHTRGRKRQ